MREIGRTNLFLSFSPTSRFDDLKSKALPIYQEIQVPHAWGQLEMQANGTGYAVFGVTHEMNVEHEYQYAAWAPPRTSSPDLVGK